MHATNRSAQECAQSSSSDAAAAKGPAKYVVSSFFAASVVQAMSHSADHISLLLGRKCTFTRIARTNPTHPRTCRLSNKQRREQQRQEKAEAEAEGRAPSGKVKTRNGGKHGSDASSSAAACAENMRVVGI